MKSKSRRAPAGKRAACKRSVSWPAPWGLSLTEFALRGGLAAPALLDGTGELARPPRKPAGKAGSRRDRG